MNQVLSSDYTIGEFLGGGKFGKTYAAVHKTTGKEVALKVILKSGDTAKLADQRKDVELEMSCMEKVEHPNVLTCFGVDMDGKFDDDAAFVLSLELAEGGVLFDILFNSGRFGDSLSRTYLHQLLDGLAACHATGIAHRDVKPENLLLDRNYALKIADFGLSHINDSKNEHIMKTQCGTMSYLGYEVIKGNSYNESADIFSAGVVLFILYCKAMPFEFAAARDWWYGQILNGRPDMFWRAHEKSTGVMFPEALKNLILRMLEPNPEKRITLEEIKTDPWYVGETLSNEMLTKVMHKRCKRTTALKPKRRKISEFKKMVKKAGAEDRALDEEGLPIYVPGVHISRNFLNGKQSENVVCDDPFGSYESAEAPTEFDDANDVSCVTSCLSGDSAPNIVDTLTGILDAARCKYQTDGFSITAEFMIEDGSQLDLSVNVYASKAQPGLRYVRFRRLAGEAIAFNELFHVLVSEVKKLVCEEDSDVDN